MRKCLRCGTEMKEKCSIKVEGAGYGIITVSYTHLDVYKRQLDFLHNRYHDDLLEQITLLIEALV